jgi:hypothetical protein
LEAGRLGQGRAANHFCLDDCVLDDSAANTD